MCGPVVCFCMEGAIITLNIVPVKSHAHTHTHTSADREQSQTLSSHGNLKSFFQLICPNCADPLCCEEKRNRTCFWRVLRTVRGFWTRQGPLWVSEKKTCPPWCGVCLNNVQIGIPAVFCSRKQEAFSGYIMSPAVTTRESLCPVSYLLHIQACGKVSWTQSGLMIPDWWGLKSLSLCGFDCSFVARVG